MWRCLVCAIWPDCLFAGLTIWRWRCIRAQWKLTRLLTESAKWEKVLERFSDKEMNEMHSAFLKKIGGIADEKEIAKNVAKSKDKSAILEERVSTYEKTLALIAEGLSLADMAKNRGMTLGTIISHLEKLKAKNPSLDLSAYKPKEKDFQIMSDAFKKLARPKRRGRNKNFSRPPNLEWQLFLRRIAFSKVVFVIGKALFQKTNGDILKRIIWARLKSESQN